MAVLYVAFSRQKTLGKARLARCYPLGLSNPATAFPYDCLTLHILSLKPATAHTIPFVLLLIPILHLRARQLRYSNSYLRQ